MVIFQSDVSLPEDVDDLHGVGPVSLKQLCVFKIQGQLYTIGYVVAGHLQLTMAEANEEHEGNSPGDQNDILDVIIQLVLWLLITMYACPMMIGIMNGKDNIQTFLFNSIRGYECCY